jgi:hypothetical protein
MPLTPDEQLAIDERFQALEDRNAKLERLIRSGKAFTNNPLALATDLDDLGSVKTHLDFEEPQLTPIKPPADVLRLYAVNGDNTATGGRATLPAFVDSGGKLTIIDVGIYTPSLTNGVNVAASTAFQAQWTRIGGAVTVSGKFNCDPVSANTRTDVGISLPVASNFGDEEDCGGTVGCRTFEGSGLVVAQTAQDIAATQFFPTSTSNAAWGFIFMYQII